MPLSDNPKDFHAWIGELSQTRPRRQAIAIALDHLRKVKGQPSYKPKAKP